ncbi:hypothetical protein [Ruminococcus intestinalis]|jgi:hypothetical protein|uniref:hypothetical protein n=1 Tax=Ruminococcus intestinalis TaxID=2763066 RepID=UPI003F7CE20A
MTIYSYLITILKNYNKSIDNIQWVGCKDFQIVKDDFLSYIQKKEYNEFDLDLPYDLLLVGENFWIELSDNGDTFVYKCLPKRPAKTINLRYFSTSNISENEMKTLENSLKLTDGTKRNLFFSLNSDNNTLKLLQDFDEVFNTIKGK